MIMKLTNIGKAMLIRALDGDGIVFTDIEIGKGFLVDGENAVSLVEPVMCVGISAQINTENYTSLDIEWNNSQILEGFKITEVGVYAQDIDDNTKKVLYAVGIEDDETAQFIPAYDSQVIEIKNSIKVYVGDAENISAVISSSLEYVTREEFNLHNNNNANPHNVTKEQVGLGNVDNVSTDNLAPKFEESNSLLNINSGETLRVIFGKLKKAISSLISHINSNKNPHNVTLEQLEGAKKEHVHLQEDIKGVLRVGAGGTGKGIVAKGALLKGNGKSEIEELLGEGALYSSAYGYPEFGILPVNLGGTGVSSYEALNEKLRNSGVPRFAVGNYKGTGNVTTGVELEFPSPPQILVVSRKSHSLSAGHSGAGFFAVRDTEISNHIAFEWKDNSVRFWGREASTDNALYGCNSIGVDYEYFVIY